MKKLKLSNLSSKEVLSKEELEDIFVSSFSGSGSGSGSGNGSGNGSGSGSGSGSVDCGENAYYDHLLSKCACNYGYYFSYPQGKCVEGVEPPDPQPKVTACIGKKEGDSCSYTFEGVTYDEGFFCRYRFTYFYCTDSMYT